MYNILIISSGQIDDENKAVNIFAFDQAKALKNAGNNVHIISLDFRLKLRKSFFSRKIIKKEGIYIYQISFPLGKKNEKLFIYFGRKILLFLFKKTFKERGIPDLIHAHFTEIAALSSAIKKKYNIPFIITEHSSLVNKDKLLKKTIYFCKNAYYNADLIITVSNALSKKIFSNFKIKSVVIPNIVDERIFFYNTSHELKRDTFNILSVGNLTENKGFDVLIEAFNNVCRYVNLHLSIIGNGHSLNSLLKLVDELELNDYVSFLGEKTRFEISKAMENSDLFILSSKSETFGVVYIEALAKGLPVIATKCGGPEDFINNQNGLLVDVDDVEQLAKSIIYMYENLHTYDKKKISDDCLKNYSAVKVSHDLIKIYKSLNI